MKCKECGQKVKSKFKVGSVWYIPATKYSCYDVIKITGVDTWDILYCSKGKEELKGAQVFSLLDAAIPFYAPPSQAQLDEWGKEIDRIGVPEPDDCAVNKVGHLIRLWRGGAYSMETFSGLRYILKDKPVDTVIKDDSELVEALKSAVSELNHVIEVMEERK